MDKFRCSKRKASLIRPIQEILDVEDAVSNSNISTGHLPILGNLDFNSVANAAQSEPTRSKSVTLPEKISVIVFNFNLPGIESTRYTEKIVNHQRITEALPEQIALRSLNGIIRGSLERVKRGNGSSGTSSLRELILSSAILFCTANWQAFKYLTVYSAPWCFTI